MPAILDDPATPTMYRVTGEAPFPGPGSPLPASILPRQVTLRDRQTVATIVPFASRDQVPRSLLLYLSDQFAREIEKGDTYPMMDTMPFDRFASYWFQNFGAIMLLGSIDRPEDVVEGKDWAKECLGSFYIKPNYPGRSSHVCNAGFLVTDASRNRGVGRLMGEAYLDYAPKLGYSYSVFNLVYETNVASCKIWDALGFKRIGRVPGCGNLKSYPGRLVDAIIYGRDLTVGEGDTDDAVSEERFEKIKFYLKHGRYPNGADRAEKSRLRSAATHYKLLEGAGPGGDVLMLKGKEVISDPGRQYDIARLVHAGQTHAGINKTTATIADKYHWRGIKDTVSDVIRACVECEDGAKAGNGLVKPSTPNQISSPSAIPPHSTSSQSSAPGLPPTSTPLAVTSGDLVVREPATEKSLSQRRPAAGALAQQHPPSESPVSHHTDQCFSQQLPASQFPSSPSQHVSFSASNTYQPIDPQILNQPYSDQSSQASPTHYGSYGPDPFPAHDGPSDGMDIDENAVRNLLTASSHDYQLDGEVGQISDQQLEMMLMQQLQDGLDRDTTRMEVDESRDDG